MQVRKLLMIGALALVLPVSASAQSWFFSPFVGGQLRRLRRLRRFP